MTRKLIIPKKLREEMTAAKTKLSAVLKPAKKFSEEFSGLEEQAEEFEAEAAKMELKCDPNDQAGLDAIERVARQARLARNKAKQGGELAEEIIEKIREQIELSGNVLSAALQFDATQTADEIAGKLLPYCHDARQAKTISRQYVPLYGILLKHAERAFSFNPALHDVEAFGKKLLETMDTILSGVSPIEFPVKDNTADQE